LNEKGGGFATHARRKKPKKTGKILPSVFFERNLEKSTCRGGMFTVSGQKKKTQRES